jgi:hypothetical protein
VLVEERSRTEAASDLVGAVSDRVRERYGARASVLVLAIPEARHRLQDGDPLMEDIIRDGRNLFGLRVQEVLGAW